MASIKKTNSTQFERLVELMKKDVELARGICGLGTGKRDVKKKWSEIALELNCLGPPTRDAYEWRKVWIDAKARVKRIMGEMEAEAKEKSASNNGIRHLTPLHKEIVALLCPPNVANAPENSLESEEETSGEVKPNSEFLDQLINGTGPFIEPIVTVTVDPIQTNQNPPHQPHGRSESFDKRFALLKKQTTIQEHTLERLTKIQENTFEIAKSLHKMVDIQEKRNRILEAELQLKRRKLELKEKELNRNSSK